MKQGFIAITSVLIISAVVLAITVSVSLLAIGEGQSAFALTQGEGTLHFVEGCAEDALLKLNASGSYVGGTITRPEGTCIVSISSSGSTYTLTVTTNATLYKRVVQVVAVRGSTITITSWKEL